MSLKVPPPGGEAFKFNNVENSEIGKKKGANQAGSNFGVGGANEAGSIGEGTAATKFTSTGVKFSNNAIDTSLSFANVGVGKAPGSVFNGALDRIAPNGEDPKTAVLNGAINQETNKLLSQIGVVS